MGGEHQTGHLPNEDKKLDSLRPGSREMERGHWESQNFQLGSSVPGRRRRLNYCDVFPLNSTVTVTDHTPPLLVLGYEYMIVLETLQYG